MPATLSVGAKLGPRDIVEAAPEADLASDDPCAGSTGTTALRPQDEGSDDGSGGIALITPFATSCVLNGSSAICLSILSRFLRTVRFAPWRMRPS